MEVLTKTKGRVEVEEKQIVNFPDGIMGFEQYKKYALMNHLSGFSRWKTAILHFLLLIRF